LRYSIIGNFPPQKLQSFSTHACIITITIILAIMLN
jgi:hypothetical protein